MTLAETIYQHSLHLPEPAAREALAFIQNLEKRYGIVPTAPKALDDTEAFLAAVAGTLGDDFPDEPNYGSAHRSRRSCGSAAEGRCCHLKCLS